jgi:iron(III) transport system ATP-binding protein
VSSPALVFEGVTKSYGATPAAVGLDLSVSRGEIVTLIGPSGCGKSTALRLMAGLERPDAGRILIADEVVADRGSFVQPEHRRIGLVFQDHALFPHLTVHRNVEFGLAALGRRQRAARVAEVLDLVQLGDHAKRFPHELSGGEQQRVALARALAPKPAVVLLDEPFSSLDENLRGQVRAELVGVLRKTGTTAVFVTHDQTEALSIGDRVVVMQKGKIDQVDTPQRVFEQPANRFVASFMGDADFLRAHVHSALLTCEIGVVSTVPGWSKADVDVDVVLRPHEVDLRAVPGRIAPGPEVIAVEYHGAFVLHTVRLLSGQTLRSWQPHTVRHPVGTPVEVGVVPGVTPTLLIGDCAVSEPPAPSASVSGPRLT